MFRRRKQMILALFVFVFLVIGTLALNSAPSIGKPVGSDTDEPAEETVNGDTKDTTNGDSKDVEPKPEPKPKPEPGPGPGGLPTYKCQPKADDNWCCLKSYSYPSSGEGCFGTDCPPGAPANCQCNDNCGSDCHRERITDSGSSCSGGCWTGDVPTCPEGYFQFDKVYSEFGWNGFCTGNTKLDVVCLDLSGKCGNAGEVYNHHCQRKISCSPSCVETSRFYVATRVSSWDSSCGWVGCCRCGYNEKHKLTKYTEKGSGTPCTTPSGKDGTCQGCQCKPEDTCREEGESCRNQGQCCDGLYCFDDNDRDRYSGGSSGDKRCHSSEMLGSKGDDCNDNNVDINPGVREKCNGHRDYDCDGHWGCDDSKCWNNDQYCSGCTGRSCGPYTDQTCGGDGCTEEYMYRTRDCVDDDCAETHCEDQEICEPEICDNGVDDDADTLVDCEDPDCYGKKGPGGDICCSDYFHCEGTSESCYCPDTDNQCRGCDEGRKCKYGYGCVDKEDCKNSEDDDKDGLIDCQDPDCRGDEGPGGNTCCMDDSDCSGSEICTFTQVCKVFAGPIADFETQPAAAKGCPTYFLDNSIDTMGTIEEWSWDFNEDGIEDSDKKNPVYTYSDIKSGMVDVTLRVTDDKGVVDVKTNKIYVCNDTDDDCYCESPFPWDCNSTNPEVHPGAEEKCHNWIDDDCDGLVDSADPECVCCYTEPCGEFGTKICGAWCP